MENAIEVKNLKKYFGSLKAVDDISLEVKKGEIFGFLGPNGAGKSTTIRCLMGFNIPDDGDIAILGMDARKNGVEIKKKVGYLPGNVKLYDGWTGWDHIKFFESVRGKSENVDELIERFGFNPNVKFRRLSSGNKQKLGLILALMHRPELIIMDEPTVGLDPLLQAEIYKVLLEMKKSGSTIFISSHNLPEVEKICDRVAIIRSGKIAAIEGIKSLSNKKLYTINARFAERFDKTIFKVKGVTKIEEIDGGVILSVSGDINPVLRVIAKHNVLSISVEHASLEDIFMKYYEKGDK